MDARDGSNTPQTKTEVRGDYIGWFDGAASEGWAQGRDRKDYVSLPVSPHDHCRDPGCVSSDDTLSKTTFCLRFASSPR